MFFLNRIHNSGAKQISNIGANVHRRRFGSHPSHPFTVSCDNLLCSNHLELMQFFKWYSARGWPIAKTKICSKGHLN